MILLHPYSFTKNLGVTMAILNGNVIGNMRGRLGNLSARTVDGKTIMSARPSSFNVNYDPAVVENRQKFAVTANLSKNILSLSNLKQSGRQSKALAFPSSTQSLEATTLIPLQPNPLRITSSLPAASAFQSILPQLP